MINISELRKRARTQCKKAGHRIKWEPVKFRGVGGAASQQGTCRKCSASILLDNIPAAKGQEITGGAWQLECPEMAVCVFRRWRTGGKEVIALFPEEPADVHGIHCMSYMRVGQHSAASPALCRDGTTVPAKRGEPDVEALIREIEGDGSRVRLRILQRVPKDAFQTRIDTLTNFRLTESKKQLLLPHEGETRNQMAGN